MTPRDRLDAIRERALGLVECASQWTARHLQPRIAQELRAERPDIHAARQRVHYLVVLGELAKLRRFPAEERNP